MHLQLVLLDPSIWNLPPEERFKGSNMKPFDYAAFKEAVKNNTDERDYKYVEEIIGKLLSIDVNKILELDQYELFEAAKAKTFYTLISKWLGLSRGARIYLNNDKNKVAVILMRAIAYEIEFVESSMNFGINQISPQFIFVAAQINNAIAEKESSWRFATPSSIAG